MISFPPSSQRQRQRGKCARAEGVSLYTERSGARFSKVSETFRARKAVFVSCVYIQDRGFKGDTTQLLIYETKRTGL